jgi:hypothetical protein
MKFRSNSVTYSLSIILLAFFIIYSLTAIGVAGTLFSSAAGLIAYGVFGKVEVAMAATILVGILLKVIYPGFKNRVEGFADATPEQIAARIARMKSGSDLEGFEDGAAAAATPESGSAGEDTHSAIASAPVTAVETEKRDKEVALAEAKDMAGFMDKAASDGLFKLGELPSEAKDGAYIDVGTTIMKSLSNLRPEQINQMTSDTKALLDTQKSLMTMLNSMKPMLVDGQQILSSFSGLFGKK